MSNFNNIKIILNYLPIFISRLEEVRLVANRGFQAEGLVSCRIRAKSFSPVFAVNHVADSL